MLHFCYKIDARKLVDQSIEASLLLNVKIINIGHYVHVKLSDTSPPY